MLDKAIEIFEKIVFRLPWLTPMGWVLVGCLIFWLCFGVGYIIHIRLWMF